MWSVVPARYVHVNYLARRLRSIDAAECRACGHTPKQALVTGLRGSTFALTILLDGRPVAMFGVAPGSLIEGVGVPWLLGTDEVLKGARQFLTVGPRVVEAMHREWPVLRNYVGADNRRAIRTLKALQFDVSDEVVVIGGMEMLAFSSGRDRHL